MTSNIPIIFSQSDKSYFFSLNNLDSMKMEADIFILVDISQHDHFTFTVEVYDNSTLKAFASTHMLKIYTDADEVTQNFKGFEQLNSDINEFHIRVKNCKISEVLGVICEPSGNWVDVVPGKSVLLRANKFSIGGRDIFSALEFKEKNDSIQCWSTLADLEFCEPGNYGDSYQNYRLLSQTVSGNNKTG